MWRQRSVAIAGRLMTSSSSRSRSRSKAWLGTTSYRSVSSHAVNSMILRSLKDHYLEISKMTPPPKINPPSPFTVVKGALETGGPVLKGAFNDEEISISVMKLLDIMPDDEDSEDNGNQLFLHVNISKPGEKDTLHFLCELYPDALGIRSVRLGPKEESSGFLEVPSRYGGPVFEDLNDKLRDAFHGYIEERGITENLFPFLQAWLYVKDHKGLTRYFKTVGQFVNESRKEEALQA